MGRTQLNRIQGSDSDESDSGIGSEDRIRDRIQINRILGLDSDESDSGESDSDESCENRSRIVPESSQNRSRTVPES